MELTCTLCKETKNIKLFTKASDRPLGYRRQCKDCINLRYIKKRIPCEDGYKRCFHCKNIYPITDFRSSKCKKCRKLGENPIGRKPKFENLNLGFKHCIKCEIEKPYNEFHSNKRNKDKLKSICRHCCKLNNQLSHVKLKSKQYNKKYKKENRSKIRKLYSEFLKRKVQKDPIFKLKLRIGERLRKSIVSKSGRESAAILKNHGCTLSQLKKHLQSQFLNWMNWDNYGRNNLKSYDTNWCIDHIVPTSLAKTESEMYAINHWSNLQPLCISRNVFEKSSHIPEICNIYNPEINSILVNLQSNVVEEE